jgi:hypothetical protein
VSLDVPTIDALIGLVNALAAGAALIVHAWGHTHPRHTPAPPPGRGEGESPQPKVE